MNIFDFENKLKRHEVNSKGAVDMDRLLGDLDLTPPPTSLFIKFSYFLAFAALISVASLAYYYSATPITNQITSQHKAKISSPTSADKSTVGSTSINVNKEESTPSTKERTIVDKTVNAPNNAQRSNLVKTIKNVASQNNKQIQKTRSNVPAQIIEDIEESKVKISPIAYLTAPELAKENNPNKLKNQTLASNITMAIEPNITKRLHDNISLLPLLETKLDELSVGYLGDKLKDCPTFGNRLWHLSLIPEVGYLAPSKTLQLTDEEYRSIYENRLENERTKGGIHASVALKFTNEVTGLYIKPGLSYARITEQLNFTDTDIQLDTILEAVYVTVSAAGDTTTTIEGERVEKTEISIRKKVHYQLHEFALPVALGYSFDFKNFSLDIEGGIQFSFLQKTQGKILNSEGGFTDLNNEQELFKNSVGLGFFGGAFLKKQISGHSEFYIGPRFTYNTLSFSSNNNPINQRYNVLGVHVGCVYAIF